MLRYRVLCLCVVALSAARAAGADDATGNGWKAGAARVVITPDKPMWMSGYAGRTKPAQGKLTDLWAKSLALEDPQGRRAVLVTMDLVGIDRELSQAVCTELGKKHSLPREAILLSVSHTHTGPVVGNNLAGMYNLDATQQQLVADYARSLQSKLVAVASEALDHLAPARLAWANGLATFAV